MVGHCWTRGVSALGVVWNASDKIFMVERCMMSLIGVQNLLYHPTVMYTCSSTFGLLLNAWNSLE